MEVSGQRQAPVAYTTTCMRSKLQEQLLLICIEEVSVSSIACDNHYPKQNFLCLSSVLPVKF